MIERVLEIFILLLVGTIIGWFVRRIWVEAIISEDALVSGDEQ